ncbi:MAG: DUF2163 domain-containing protein [Pseudomonadota bacterium]
MPLPMSAGLLAVLRGGNGLLSRLLTITPEVGPIMRWTDNNRNVQIGDDIYRAGIGFNLSNLEHRGDGSVSGGDLEALLSIDGVTRGQLLGGYLDGARAELAICTPSEPALGFATIAYGWIGENDERGTEFATLEVRGLGEALRRQIISVLTPSCPARFASQPGDERRPCGVDPAAHTVAVSVLEASLETVTVSGADPAALYQGGLLTFTNGALAGVRVGIRKADLSTGLLTVYRPFAELPAAGDTGSLLAGCDKSVRTCRDRYQNVERFRGAPFIAGGDYLVRVAGR